jgi:hypothetical protein
LLRQIRHILFLVRHRVGLRNTGGRAWPIRKNIADLRASGSHKRRQRGSHDGREGKCSDGSDHLRDFVLGESGPRYSTANGPRADTG